MQDAERMSKISTGVQLMNETYFLELAAAAFDLLAES